MFTTFPVLVLMFVVVKCAESYSLVVNTNAVRSVMLVSACLLLKVSILDAVKYVESLSLFADTLVRCFVIQVSLVELKDHVK